jgi:hypothetical protein
MGIIFTVVITCADLVSFVVVLTYEHNSCLQGDKEKKLERTGFEREVATNRREVAYRKLTI